MSEARDVSLDAEEHIRHAANIEGMTFREILAPLHRQVRESGITDEELDALLEEARNAVY